VTLIAITAAFGQAEQVTVLVRSKIVPAGTILERFVTPGMGDLQAASFVTPREVSMIYMAAAQKGATVPGRSDIAQRVWQALEAAHESVAGLPVRVADAVLVALGSSAAEHEELVRDLTRQFRSHMIYAV
jgi:hypothetical protein